MSESVVARVPSLFRWKGAKQGRTMFSAQAGRLTLTDVRLLWEPARGEMIDVPLGAVESVELTGKVVKNLTVGYRTTAGTEHSTFGTQQLGMPQGEQWVAQIRAAADAARSGTGAAGGTPGTPGPHGTHGTGGTAPGRGPAAGAGPLLHGPGAVYAHRHPPFVEFAQQGPAPLLLAWRVHRTLAPQVVDPATTGRVEVWSDVLADGPVRYLHLAAGYRPDGSLRVLAAAETMPEMHDACYLGVFLDGLHHNLGAHEDCRDLEAFQTHAVEVVLGVLDGDHGPRSGPSQAPQSPAPAPPPAPPPAPEPPAPPPPPPPVADPVADPAALTREEAEELLGRLDDDAGTTRDQSPEEVREYLGLAARACEAVDREACAAELLIAADSPTVPQALADAGEALLEAGLGSLAIVPLRAALAHGDRRPRTVQLLVFAHDLRDEVETARQVLRDSAWAREQSDELRGLWIHYAAMSGDLAEVRRSLPQVGTDSVFGEDRQRALDRLARADAIGPAPVGPASPEEALRYWDAVLQGTVLVHVSREGVEDMGGRYAAVWDDVQRMAEVLAGLDAAVAAAERPAPTRVVAAPDRDSQVLGWVLATRYGVGAPALLTDADALDDDAPGTTLVAAYTWAGVLDEASAARLRSDPRVVVFAYSLEWTRFHRLVPDVVGLEAQMITPPWGERMKVDSLVADDLPPGGRPGITTIPADTRPPADVGRDIAEAVAEATVDAATSRPAVTLVERLRDAGVPAGILGATRDQWIRGGPVRSAHF